MSDSTDNVQAEEQMLTDAKAKGGLATLKVFTRLSGPGWLQSAITLGGGSLSSALFLGVIGGYGMLWVQLVAMFLGVVMLCAISYVTLSTDDTPFNGIRKHINPVLAWGWLIASLAANMIWVLPQYSLAYGALTQNIAPNLFENPDSDTNKYLVSLCILVVVTLITFSYGSKGKGIKIYETILKCMVAFIVLAFMGVVIKLSSILPWGDIFRGMIPNFALIFRPSDTLQPLLDAIPDAAARDYWTSKVLVSQRDIMTAAAATAVGINMTFLLPYSLIAKKWNKKFRGLTIFDLSTGMVIPFVIATGCVVIASTASFHTLPYEGLFQEGTEANYVVSETAPAKIVGQYEGALTSRGSAVAIETTPIDNAEKLIASTLIKRDNKQFAAAIGKLTGDKRAANLIFGFGAFAMALSTISLLMLISGFVVCEIGGFQHGGIEHKLGTLLGAGGIFWPELWSGASLAYLAVPTSVIGFVLMPIASVTFLIMLNSKRLLGNERPKGGKRWAWNLLMGASVGIMGSAAVVTVWPKTLKIAGEAGADPTVIPMGKIFFLGFVALAICGQIYMFMKHKNETTNA